MSEDLNQNGNEENGDIPEIELIIKVGLIGFRQHAHANKTYQWMSGFSFNIKFSLTKLLRPTRPTWFFHLECL